MSDTPQVDQDGHSTSIAFFIENKLRPLCRQFMTTCGDANTVFSHVLAGADLTPGAIRISAVESRSSLIEDARLLHPSTNHEDALKLHVQNLSRGHTFLNFVQRHMNTGKHNYKELLLSLKFKAEGTESAYRIEKARRSRDIVTFSGTYTRAFAEQLLPKDRAGEYVSLLYSDMGTTTSRKAQLSAFAEELELYQYNAFPYIHLSQDVIEGEDDTPHKHWPKAAKDQWRTLRALGEFQSALLFCSGGSNAQQYCDIHVVGVKSSKTARHVGGEKTKADVVDLYGIVIVAGPATRQQLKKISESLIALIKEVADQDPNYMAVINSLVHECGLTPRGIGHDSYSTEVRSLFHLDCQKDRTYFITSCFTHMLERLGREVHEGESLDFWLMAADRTEIEDHPYTQFKPLDDRFARLLTLFNCNKYSGFFPRGVLQNDDLTKRNANFASHVHGCISDCVDQLTKEHFPWFRNGRNALLWDTTRDCFQPCGLVSYEGSSWGQLMNEQYRGEATRIDLPSLLLGFVGGSPREVGIIQHERGDRVKKLLTLRQDGWTLAQHDQRSRTLRGLLGKRLGLEVNERNVADVKAFVNICMTVADNPRIGGTLVILDDRKCTSSAGQQKGREPFSQLGDHWDIDTSLEDRIALIGHDGATLVRLGNEKWKYRFLLSSDGVPTEIREQLQSFAVHHEHPLSSVGSRRWSAALASFKQEVLAIVVVSQDGGIQCWFPAEEWRRQSGSHRKRDAQYYGRIVRDSAVYRFRKNKKPDKLLIRDDPTQSAKDHPVSDWEPVGDEHQDIDSAFVE